MNININIYEDILQSIFSDFFSFVFKSLIFMLTEIISESKYLGLVIGSSICLFGLKFKKLVAFLFTVTFSSIALLFVDIITDGRLSNLFSVIINKVCPLISHESDLIDWCVLLIFFVIPVVILFLFPIFQNIIGFAFLLHTLYYICLRILQFFTSSSQTHLAFITSFIFTACVFYYGFHSRLLITDFFICFVGSVMLFSYVSHKETILKPYLKHFDTNISKILSFHYNGFEYQILCLLLFTLISTFIQKNYGLKINRKSYIKR